MVQCWLVLVFYFISRWFWFFLLCMYRWLFWLIMLIGWFCLFLICVLNGMLWLFGLCIWISNVLFLWVLKCRQLMVLVNGVIDWLVFFSLMLWVMFCGLRVMVLRWYGDMYGIMVQSWLLMCRFGVLLMIVLCVFGVLISIMVLLCCGVKVKLFGCIIMLLLVLIEVWWKLCEWLQVVFNVEQWLWYLVLLIVVVLFLWELDRVMLQLKLLLMLVELVMLMWLLLQLSWLCMLRLVLNDIGWVFWFSGMFIDSRYWVLEWLSMFFLVCSVEKLQFIECQVLLQFIWYCLEVLEWLQKLCIELVMYSVLL